MNLFAEDYAGNPMFAAREIEFSHQATAHTPKLRSRTAAQESTA